MNKLMKKANNILPAFTDWWDNFVYDLPMLASWRRGMNLPATNIEETKDGYKVDIAVPGMRKEDFSIEMENKTLHISCKKEVSHEEKEKNYTRKEFSYTSFSRRFDLPTEVETAKIRATYREGILSIHLPKKEVSKSILAKSIQVE